MEMTPQSLLAKEREIFRKQTVRPNYKRGKPGLVMDTQHPKASASEVHK